MKLIQQNCLHFQVENKCATSQLKPGHPGASNSHGFRREGGSRDGGNRDIWASVKARFPLRGHKNRREGGSRDGGNRDIWVPVKVNDLEWVELALSWS